MMMTIPYIMNGIHETRQQRRKREQAVVMMTPNTRSEPTKKQSVFFNVISNTSMEFPLIQVTWKHLNKTAKQRHRFHLSHRTTQQQPKEGGEVVRSDSQAKPRISVDKFTILSNSARSFQWQQGFFSFSRVPCSWLGGSMCLLFLWINSCPSKERTQ